jgi:chromosome segregation ATPase
MKSDPGLLFLATLGAAFLTAGGAFLRAALGNGRLFGPPRNSETDTLQRLAHAEAELAALRDELTQTIAAREAHRIEMVEQRQRSERQVQGAQAEIQRLAAELEAEKGRSKSSEDEAKAARAKLTQAEEEQKRARPAAPAPDPKAIAALQSEVGELQKKLKATNDERDVARGKAEALERLVEGVRARSRELAAELKALKDAPPDKGASPDKVS